MATDTATDMDITTRVGNKAQLLSAAVFIAALAPSGTVYAEDSRFAIKALTELSYKQREYQDGEQLDAFTYEISPTLSYVLDGNKFDAAFIATHTLLGSDDQSIIDNQSYTNYSGNLSLKPLNWWNVGLSATRNYRATNPFDSALGGRYFNGDSLSEVTSYQANTNFVVNNSQISGLLGLQYSKTQSELVKGTSSFISNFDNQSAALNLRLNSAGGQRLNWSLGGSRVYTERENYSDYDAVSADVRLSVPLYENVFFRIQGNHEKYDVDSINTNFGGLQYRDQTSYGAGLEWRRSAKRYIALTYNSADRAGLEQRETYVGFDMEWAISERTSIAADYGKRFYGTAKSLTIKHQNKNVTSSIGHKEDISTYSRLGVEQEVGVYVCPIEATGLFDCTRAESGYTPLPGEFLINAIDNITEVNEEVRFVKTTFANFAWDVTAKSNIGIGLNRSETLYLETNRLRETDSANVFWRYKLNKLSNLNTTLTWRDDNGDGGILSGESLSAAIGYTRQLGRSVDMAINYRYVDRQADDEQYTLKENQLSASVNVRF